MTVDSNSIRVLVVDDTVTYRKIVSDVLADIPGMEVVGVAANGKIALDKIERLRPDVLTLDLEMPEMNGLELLRRLQQSGSDVGAIVLSGSNTQGAKDTMAALEMGAFDFVAKPSGRDAEDNADILRQELLPKIEAFARRRTVRGKLRSEQTSRCSISPTRHEPLAGGGNDVAKRMGRIVESHSGKLEVIAVGISTGGPQALNQMLPRLPSDLPVGMLIVQHMPPIFTKSLADDLDKRCGLKITEAVDGDEVLAGRVLIAPGGMQMKVVMERELAVVRTTDDPPENSCRPSVDYLFRSVARAYGPCAMGVIMTGMGNDGTLGCRQMKQRGAKIIAQSEETCVVYGMPREPVEEGIADIVAPLDTIADEITRLARGGVMACG